jgi:hypothetical protein
MLYQHLIYKKYVHIYANRDVYRKYSGHLLSPLAASFALSLRLLSQLRYCQHLLLLLAALHEQLMNA